MNLFVKSMKSTFLGVGVDSNTKNKLKILLWREVLLLKSEAFVWNSMSSQLYDSYLAGMKNSQTGSNYPNVSSFMESKLARVLFRITGSSRRLRKFIVSSHFDVIHAHFGWDAIWMYRLARRLSLPLIVSLHGYDVMQLPKQKNIRGRIYRRTAKYVLNRVDRVLCTSSFIRDNAIEIFSLDPERTFVHYMGCQKGIDLPEIKSRNRILFVGRLIRGKGGSELLSAFNMIFAQRPDISLIVVGDGPERAKLELQARTFNLPVRFLGALKHERVIKLMKSSRLLVMTSTTRYGDPAEGLGMVLVEAMSNGLPCFAFRNGGVEEIFGENSKFQLIEDFDSHVLAERILKVYDDWKILEAMSRHGLERHEKLFDRDRQDLTLLSHYEATSKITG